MRVAPVGAVADAGRILLAADAFGGAWKLIRATVEYTLTRVQYGTPVAQFQGVKHQLANLAAEAVRFGRRSAVTYVYLRFVHFALKKPVWRWLPTPHSRALHVERLSCSPMKIDIDSDFVSKDEP